MATAPMVSMSGELMAWARTERRLASNSRRAACLNRIISQNSMLKALTMRFPVMVSCRMFWISASLSCPLRVVCRTWRPIRRAEPRTTGTNKQQHPGQLAAQGHHHEGGKDQGEELLQEFRQHRRHGKLHPLDIVDQGRDDGAGRILLEERDGAPQNGVVEIIAEVGDHAEAGIVHQVGSAVIEDPLQQSGNHQREGDDGPCIVEMRGDNLLQAYAEARSEEGDGAVGRIGVEHAVENGTDQQETEGIQKAHAGHQDDRRKRLQPIRLHVTQQAQHLLQEETPEARRCMERILLL